jgi:MFS family permease
LLRRPRLYTAILLELAATPLGAYAFVSAAAYARDLRLAAVVATAAITAVAAGNALGRIAGGAASDRAGVDRVMLGALVLDLVAAALLFFHPGAGSLVLGSLLAGIGFGAPAGVVGRLAEDAAPDAPNAALGLIFTGFAAGASAGSLLGAAIGGTTAWLALGTAALAGLAVVSFRLKLTSASRQPS